MNSPLHYIVRQPKIEQENPPLLILLHGYGSNEEDLFSFGTQLHWMPMMKNFLI